MKSIIVLKEELDNWRAHTWAHIKNEAPKRPSWDRPGLEAIVASAQKDFEAKAKFYLPHNLSVHGPYVSYRREGPIYKNLEMVDAAAKFSGWLRGAAAFPGLRLLLARTTSHRGMNSPSTHLNPWRIAKRYDSPGKAERAFWKTYRRAAEILRPYGLRPAWAGLAEALSFGSRRPGKAALRTAAHTLALFLERRWVSVPMYLRPVEFLTKVHGWRQVLNAAPAIKAFCCEQVRMGSAESLAEAFEQSDRLIPDATDGVEGMVDPHAVIKKCGIRAMPFYDGYRSQEWLVVDGRGRTYHAFGEGRQAIIQAIAAWRRQAELKAEKADLIAAIR